MATSLLLWLLEKLAGMGLDWAAAKHATVITKQVQAQQRVDEHAATAVATQAEAKVEQERSHDTETDAVLRRAGPGTDGTGGSLHDQTDELNTDIDQR